jgi:hypothetical protein
MTFLNDTLKLTADTGDQFISREQVGRIHRHLSGTQQVCLDTVFLELGPVDESAILKFFDNP